MNKVIDEFDRVFWDINTDYYGVADDNYEHTGRETVWMNMYCVVQRPVLVTFFIGEHADFSETNMNDADVKEWGEYFKEYHNDEYITDS